MLLLEDGRSLPESGAILFYLAENTPFLPEDTFDRAQVLRWIFFEQYSHEPYIAVARFWRSIAGMTPEREAALPEKMERGYAALDVMEIHLRDHDWFVGQRCSIADIALLRLYPCGTGRRFRPDRLSRNQRLDGTHLCPSRLCYH